MIRIKKTKSNAVIDTYYNKTFEDKAQEFHEPSLTDQSYLTECDLYTILARGQVAARPLEYGNQENYKLEDLINVRLEYERKFNSMSDEDRAAFDNNILNFINYVSNPANYEPELIPEIVPEPVEPDIKSE